METSRMTLPRRRLMRALRLGAPRIKREAPRVAAMSTIVSAAEGLTAREIADRLGVRERTVTTHLARIYGKLGVGNRLAALRLAARSGLVSISQDE